MPAIRFGFRTVKVKTYKLSKFNISKDEAESFAVEYDGFDLWNTNKSLSVEIPQIEKRVKYFHVMFVPFFPIETQWTIRNKKGVFKINQVCEQKVISVYPKSYAPWYSFLAPIICLLAITLYVGFEIIQEKISKYKYATEIERKYLKLNKELDSVSPPYYMVFDKPYPLKDEFQRVDSIINNTFYISNIKNKKSKLEYDSPDYLHHKEFKTKKIESLIVQKDDLLLLIPKNIEENSNLRNNGKFKRIITISDLETPNLDFDFDLGGISIKNSGKPLTLIDFENKSTEKDKWSVVINKYIDTNKKIRANYTPKNKSKDLSELVFIFSDNEGFYEYKVQATYMKTKSFTAFVDTSFEMIK
ncbi:hypothetical protein [Tenacibaculum ovolyticum]|uniref:hypothetical protein n=1 Tax=Tenacibaculum ovolyticum TaxID=104270 RepID=UPI0007ECF7A8|nr:hypothetical protein [Tenacibaculum ovolyticum]